MVEVGELCYYDYRVLLRDAVIFEAQKTASGRDWLDQCWILEQTAPDRGRLRDRFGERSTHGE